AKALGCLNDKSQDVLAKKNRKQEPINASAIFKIELEERKAEVTQTSELGGYIRQKTTQIRQLNDRICELEMTATHNTARQIGNHATKDTKVQELGNNLDIARSDLNKERSTIRATGIWCHPRFWNAPHGNWSPAYLRKGYEQVLYENLNEIRLGAFAYKGLPDGTKQLEEKRETATNELILEFLAHFHVVGHPGWPQKTVKGSRKPFGLAKTAISLLDVALPKPKADPEMQRRGTLGAKAKKEKKETTSELEQTTAPSSSLAGSPTTKEEKSKEGTPRFQVGTQQPHFMLPIVSFVDAEQLLLAGRPISNSGPYLESGNKKTVDGQLFGAVIKETQAFEQRYTDGEWYTFEGQLESEEAGSSGNTSEIDVVDAVVSGLAQILTSQKKTLVSTERSLEAKEQVLNAKFGENSRRQQADYR
ncbi:MAG: hypothetical protein Q9226_002466, partial [Calogaya cf. arnoldii]